MKKVLIIGAGPAGLTAAYELLDKSDDYEVTVLEESACLGGISRTVNYRGNRMDMGGHRFFSKVPEVNDWWEKMLPTQGAMPFDDVQLGRSSTTVPGGPDPEKEDRVMLRRNRLSRIYFNSKFFDYPISFKFETIKNMGFGTTLVAGFSYLKTLFFKRKENSLEDFYINRFGKKLYSMFFERYTENLWGRHPSEISPEWGAQRVKGLSIKAILKDIFGKIFHKKNRKVETSLIEEFAYPKLGPGQLWEITAAEIEKKGGKILKEARVTKLVKDSENRLSGLVYEKDGKEVFLEGDYIISSMPVKDLVAGMNDVPAEIAAIAKGLPYRDYMTVGVLIPHCNLKNETKIKTIGNIVPDNWIYVHDRNVKMGRLQVYNNWSPYLVKDIGHTVWIGLEYFCNEGDEMWSMSDEEFAKMGISEMVTMGLIDSADEVLDSHVERVKKAYPAYFDTYEHMDELRAFLDTVPNLFCVGRNGQHRYNNIDHSMCTSFEAVKNILAGSTDKDNIWKVNTEQEYHETKAEEAGEK
ncbi:MAG: NAD(P)/FAD-dependent oxidoreductase [Lachnospiraceae bacterium]|nr:NAD(P)/FAD-dependent oxidoreductase [Lachnospiraceae bacterium]